MIVTCENCKVNKGEEEDMTYESSFPKLPTWGGVDQAVRV